ncbi:hypothetical protein EAO75_44425, partial [Streptomyces sp. uw30]|uniref:ATP-grasp domain-containing protein n=1 Tax=Streptomyces sp. uw30 TaxID=1828179 RepID=UPI0013072E27
MRPCLLLVDGRPGTFTDHVLSRDDLDLVLLRFEEHLSSLPTDHLLRTADIPTFTIAVDADIRREAERYLTWVAGLRVRPAHFCNPQEPLQEISQRFAGLVGLPHLDAEQVAWVRDKTAMKRRFLEIGIPCAEFSEVADGDEVLGFAAAHGWPLILKPVDGWSSIDTYKLNDEHDLARLLPLPPSRRWMVEEFLTGREYQLCALVAHGRVLDTYVSWTPCALLETIYGGINGSISLGVDNELGIDEQETGTHDFSPERTQRTRPLKWICSSDEHGGTTGMLNVGASGPWSGRQLGVVKLQTPAKPLVPTMAPSGWTCAHGLGAVLNDAADIGNADDPAVETD